MGTSLPRYLDIKVHQSVLQQCYNEITILGAYSRSHPSIVFDREKRDKPFNWQRPTARIINESNNRSRLLIECFPGHDHVAHYAEIIATYLKIRQQEGGVQLTPSSSVSYHAPSCSDTQAALRLTNLAHLPPEVDTVVLGLVHRLGRLTGAAQDWTGVGGAFGWRIRQFHGRNVAFVGFRPSFWGDIAGEVVHHLARQGVREVLYFGKLGSVRPGVRPNTWLATGQQSTITVQNQVVEWENVLHASVQRMASDCTLTGHHVTLGSVLDETKDWLARLPACIDFVDPEVGMMAQAAVRSGVRFGYLHIISDNVAAKFDEDLSNERMQGVLSRRAKLYHIVQDVLGHHLSKQS